MRIAVVGAGAMGSLFAGRLALGGQDVTLVDVDTMRLSALCTRGIEMRLAGRMERVRVPCGRPQGLARGQDVLLLLTKFASLGQALSGTIHALRGEGCVAVFSNGLGIAERLEKARGDATLAIGVTDVAADLRDGIVHSDGTGQVVIGTTRFSTPNAAFENLCVQLGRAGFPLLRKEPIAQAVWEKVAFNAAFNALATITGLAVGGLDNASGRSIIGAALEEAAAVARAEGIVLDVATVRERIEAAFRHQPHHLPSMLQDRMTARPTEIEAINGAIAERARAAGIAAPVNRTLADLVRLTGG